MYSDDELLEEGNRIIAEFSGFTKKFEIIESFYHGTFGRCLRFEIQTFEGRVTEISPYVTTVILYVKNYGTKKIESVAQRVEFLLENCIFGRKSKFWSKIKI